MSNKVIVQHEILELSTGKITKGEMKYSSSEIAIFLWEEGNYSCDCNRGIFFDGREIGCSLVYPEKFGVRLLLDGKEIYRDNWEELNGRN